jgi:hypothetical protein
MKKLILPEWTKCLPNHSRINSKDMVIIYGYKNANDMSNHIKGGYIPDADFKVPKKGRRPYFLWSLGYLRAIESNQNSQP